MQTIPATLKAALEIAKQNNPNIMAARSAYDVAVKDVSIATGTLLPEVVFQAQGQRIFGDDPQNVIGAEFRDTLDVTINANLPLYQGGVRYAQIRQAKQGVGAAKFAVYTAHREVMQQVKSIWSNYQAASQQIRAFKAQVEAAKIAFDGASQEAFLGAKSTLDVLNLQDDLINAKINLVQAEQQRDLFTYQLFNVIGHLTAQDLKLPTEYYDDMAHSDGLTYTLFGFGDTADYKRP